MPAIGISGFSRAAIPNGRQKGIRPLQGKERVVHCMRRFALLFVTGISAFLSVPDAPAIGQERPSALLLAERQNSDVRVVMYMTPW